MRRAKGTNLGFNFTFPVCIAQGKENEIYSFKVLKQTQDSVLFEISYFSIREIMGIKQKLPHGPSLPVFGVLP